eukprot:TRINITY_DN55354_c0_g1_i1.p1 TRINITY_DN55354_c0_g1~~TRINITY_DN55354_c0_g1_i1.p1  ORF type:complete len:146 (+),score=14.61 TRINITY_DN55354_c0_g1_i1:47-484(+)
MPLRAILFVGVSAYLSLSGAYRRRDEQHAELDAARSNASEAAHNVLRGGTRKGTSVCRDAMSSDAATEYYDSGDCPADIDGIRCGCNIGCHCSFGESCYSTGFFQEFDENSKQLGQCYYAKWAIGLLGAVAALSLCFCCCLIRIL